ncbi:site-specific integrase [Dysgonomonas sp. Shenzhen-Wh21]|uniref:site-specific integrase n=1 Tax=Dysgonomonas TaxID=156973 RepID=UPI00208E7980|nr:site-specific integrase [Dysgonomonas mossii]
MSIPESTLFLKRDKKNKKGGKIPLHIRFTRIDGEEIKFSLGKKGKPFKFLEEEWDNKNKCPYDPSLKIIISKELNRINSAVIDAVRHDEELTKDLLKKIVKNEIADESKNASFFDYFNKYIAMQEKKGNMSNGTFKSYRTTFRALEEFRKEIRIKDINEKFVNDFEKFLIKRGNEAGRGDVEGSRYNRLRHLRAVINYIGTRQKIKIENPFQSGDISIKEPPTNDIFLEKEELNKLNTYFLKEVTHGSLESDVLAMFLFSCMTGLRIGDVLTLKWKHIDRSDEPWVISKILEKKVGGNEVPLENIISKYALCLLDWTQDDYNNLEQPERFVFPQIERTKINTTLRECAEKAGIDKHLTFHSSRRTCATNFMINGMDRYALMRFMGHKNFNTTLRYVKWSGMISKKFADKIEVVKVNKPLVK